MGPLQSAGRTSKLAWKSSISLPDSDGLFSEICVVYPIAESTSDCLLAMSLQAISISASCRSFGQTKRLEVVPTSTIFWKTEEKIVGWQRQTVHVPKF
ncbi:hypothetical protein HUJ04_001104 [Dendroctonus ponderosae]|nr:hypothetical protein HUJ04_001104 [Dendroctonus ponderosae]